MSQDSILLYLARKGALDRYIELSTIKISKELKTSQQTVSRKLVELEAKDFIERIPSTRGIKIRFKENGKNVLEDLYANLKTVLKETKPSIKGVVVSGLGEGAYYVSLKPYLAQFKNKLGIIPYKGTLNLRVDHNHLLSFISSMEKITINGFKTKTRSFGPIDAYKINYQGVDAAIIIPDRTSHKRETIEIISKVYLRDKFSLKDGDEVEIKNG
ncbi:MAG: DUF120 domain-containing protein [Candidatus Woesearchaeota archaeon]